MFSNPRQPLRDDGTSSVCSACARHSLWMRQRGRGSACSTFVGLLGESEARENALEERGREVDVPP
eukprot:3906533-Rhodomonas_salina.5